MVTLGLNVAAPTDGLRSRSSSPSVEVMVKVWLGQVRLGQVRCGAVWSGMVR